MQFHRVEKRGDEIKNDLEFDPPGDQKFRRNNDRTAIVEGSRILGDHAAATHVSENSDPGIELFGGQIASFPRRVLERRGCCGEHAGQWGKPPIKDRDFPRPLSGL